MKNNIVVDRWDWPEKEEDSPVQLEFGAYKKGLFGNWKPVALNCCLMFLESCIGDIGSLAFCVDDGHGTKECTDYQLCIAVLLASGITLEQAEENEKSEIVRKLARDIFNHHIDNR